MFIKINNLILRLNYIKSVTVQDNYLVVEYPGAYFKKFKLSIPATNEDLVSIQNGILAQKEQERVKETALIFGQKVLVSSDFSWVYYDADAASINVGFLDFSEVSCALQAYSDTVMQNAVDVLNAAVYIPDMLIF